MKPEAAPRINVFMVGVIYVALFGVAVAVDVHHRIFRFPAPAEQGLAMYAMDVLWGVLAALPVVLFTRVAMHYSKRVRDLAVEFNGLLGPLSHGELFFLCAFSSIGEEFFFRGFLQGELGLLVATVIFGAFHVGPARRFWPWTIFALVVGLGLGGLYEWRGDLLSPIAMHFLINYVNLLALTKLKPAVERETPPESSI